MRLLPGAGFAITTTGSAPKVSANSDWSLKAAALGSMRRSTRASGRRRVSPTALPADRRSASSKRRSGQREGTVNNDRGGREVAPGGEDAASLVAKEERNKILIMEWRRLGCGRSAAVGPRGCAAGRHDLDADIVAVAVAPAERRLRFQDGLHQAGKGRVDADDDGVELARNRPQG